MNKTAIISECGTYRYRLGRRWGEGRALVFVMLNPSTADDKDDDPTIRRCVHFTEAHGYRALEVVNLFAFRATKPAELKKAGYPIGPENDTHIRQAIHEGSTLGVCCAWGSNATRLSRPTQVLSIIRQLGRMPFALAFDQHGTPRHPLMLRNDCRMTPVCN